jgi:hypothetical protein
MRGRRAAKQTGGEAAVSLTGEELLCRAADLVAVYLRENLSRLAPDDPSRAEIEARVCQRSGPAGARVLTGEELLREGARLYAEYITQRLADVSEPDRWRVVAAAERLRSLAAEGGGA